MAKQGDPRVHAVMNLVLSALYATIVVWGLSFVGILAFTWKNVAFATVAVVAITYLVVWR